MIHLSPHKEAYRTDSRGRRKSMDPVSEFIHLEELPSPGDRFELQDLLGVGTSSKVYSAVDKQKGEKVAVKIISNIAENILEIESEFRVYSLIGGQGFAPEFHGTYLHALPDGKREIWFVMELCKGYLVSNLLKRLQQQGKHLKEEHIAILLKAFLMAVHNLHGNEIIHRDIRAANFILLPQGEVKLIDYGSCALVQNTNGKAHSSIGAPYWMAPEVIACEQMLFYSKSCDIWSLGITAIELADLLPPLSDIYPVRAMFQIARYPPPTIRSTSELSDCFKDFVDECLVRNADHRPCAAELMFHPFIANVEESDNQMTLEEYLDKKTSFSMGEKGKKLLCELAETAKNLFVPFAMMEPPCFTVKNWHLKKNPDSSFIKILPDDVACLENLSEESIFDLLQQRLLQNEGFTFIGDVLLSINPRKELPVYNIQVQSKYFEKARSDNGPHIFAVADRAYQQMLHHKRSQVVILQGFSGSGKSFMATHLVNHLSFLGRSVGVDIAEKIPHLCLLMDSLGSARVGVNPSASRYLKTVSVTFTKIGKITGAIINAALLDTKRVSLTLRNESNYLIFYYVYEGLKSEKRLSEFGLEKLSSLKYLPQKEELESKELVDQYNKILEALRSLVFTEEEILAVLKMLATILILGDVDFQMKDKTIEPKNPELFATISNNPQIKKWKFTNFFSKSKTVEDAQNKRDHLAQFLYVNLFDWIISVLNRQLSFSRLVLGDCNAVHVIDPPGFQSTENNQIFHLTANILNDHVQNHLHRLMFFKELEEYKEEGVDVPFKCEEFVIQEQNFSNMYENYSNLLKVIEEAPEDISSSKWKSLILESVKGSRISIEKNKIIINHLFEKVGYDINEIIKSETIKHTELESILKSSSDHVTEPVFCKASCDHVSEIQRSRKLLSEVLDVLTEDFPHLVICLKSKHNVSEDASLNDEIMIQQMRIFKLQETAVLRQKGYARRLDFSEFLNRYKYLAFDFDEEVELTKDNCRLLLIRLKMNGWEIGEKKVFLKYYAEEYLSRLYETHVKKIVKVQAMARRFIVKTRQGKMHNGKS